MEMLPSSPHSQNVIGIRAERFVRQFQLRRPAIVLLFSLLAIALLSVALIFVFSAARLQTIVADNQTEAEKIDAERSNLKGYLNTNAQLQAANDAKKGSSVGRFFRRYIFGVPTVVIGVIKDNTSPTDELVRYSNWINETSVTEAQLKTQQSQLHRDITELEQRRWNLAVQRPSLSAKLDSECWMRNCLCILAIAAGLVAFVASRARTTQSIHSVITAFTADTEAFALESTHPDLLADKDRRLPSSDETH